MTVRNNKLKIIQYHYGDDNFDPVKVEFQQIPLVKMSLEEIYAHYQVPSDATKDAVYTTSYTKSTITRINKQKKQLDIKIQALINYMIEKRDAIVNKVFHNSDYKTMRFTIKRIYKL